MLHVCWSQGPALLARTRLWWAKALCWPPRPQLCQSSQGRGCGKVRSQPHGNRDFHSAERGRPAGAWRWGAGQSAGWKWGAGWRWGACWRWGVGQRLGCWLKWGAEVWPGEAEHSALDPLSAPQPPFPAHVRHYRNALLGAGGSLGTVGVEKGGAGTGGRRDAAPGPPSPGLGLTGAYGSCSLPTPPAGSWKARLSRPLVVIPGKAAVLPLQSTS